ncbi:hypothetical protein SLEP1_g53565 [Rubroshorea leprosula]|uniref:Zinc knuckle CX2CX4HX4C domain-containing protein n=1 Tax=Rubroshorea leprosula TaxID=152421 RepID=A0AAV5MAX2_9ROSI|nr:hypothetical protein SLEP1_g53565 [Rubroshorea leprosula]
MGKLTTGRYRGSASLSRLTRQTDFALQSRLVGVRRLVVSSSFVLMAESNVKALTAALGKQLSLTAEEDVGLDLDDGNCHEPEEGTSKWCIVGTVLTRKRYNMEAMESKLAGVWRPVKAGPWRFADHVMVLKETQGGTLVSKDELFEVPFWIQIHGLPPSRITEATGRRIGVELGHLLEVDTGDGHVWGLDFIRVRVLIDSRKPLCRGMKLSLKGDMLWVSFCYERLPHFCYCCGMLDHVERECELGLEMERMGVIERSYDDKLWVVSKPQSDNPSKARSLKREARERCHRGPHPSPSSGQIKRKEKQFQTIVAEELEGLKRVKGTNDVGDAVILLAGIAMQARQSS